MSQPMTVRTPHILVVDDDREIRDLLRKFLAKHDYRVTVAADGKALKRALSDWHIDAIILDLMLPGVGGLSLCQEVRSTSDVPIIMLTAMGEETDRIIGLEMGADDYLPKPFNPRELLARIRAVLRRTQFISSGSHAANPRASVRFGDWQLQPAQRELMTCDGVLVDLTSGEIYLLLAFVEHPNHVLSRDQLLDLTQGRAATIFDRSIDVQVSRLRRKIEVDPAQPEIIKTVRGGGYMFVPEVIRDEEFHPK